MLTEQLKKDSFKWTEEATKAFRLLQQTMTNVPSLAFTDFIKFFIVETDALGYDLGAVLMEDSIPIGFC